jgi:sensor histidine kinase YesM
MPELAEQSEAWKTYRAIVWQYLRWLPLGPAIATIPLLFALAEPERVEHLALRAKIAAVYGLVVPLTILVSHAAVYALRIWLAERSGRQIRVSFLLHLLVSFTSLLVGIWLSIWTIHWLFDVPVGGGQFFVSIIFGSLVLIFFALHYAYQQSRQETLSLRATVAEAKYHTLENQMRPHFLFNALNSLAELIEVGQPNAAETTYKLSELYRKILANSDRKTATLSSELDIVRAYLEIEQLRFGDRLHYAFKLEAGADALYLPSLMLQTLVENALKHGITPALSGGELIVTIVRADKGLWRAEVSNTGRPLNSSLNNGGTGLANTEARLDLLYGNQHQFQLATDLQGRTVASFFFTGERLD